VEGNNLCSIYLNQQEIENGLLANEQKYALKTLGPCQGYKTF